MRTWSATRWAARSPRSWRWTHPDAGRLADADRSAGLGAEINAGYIEGFVAAGSRRELKPVLEQLFADPALVSRQMVDDVLKYKRLDGVR